MLRYIQQACSVLQYEYKLLETSLFFIEQSDIFIKTYDTTK